MYIKTGVFDKKGVEIKKGDRVLHGYEHPDFERRIGKVVWRKDIAAFWVIDDKDKEDGSPNCSGFVGKTLEVIQ